MTTAEESMAHEAALDSLRGWLIVALGVCMLTTIWGTLFTFTVYASQLSATFDRSGERVTWKRRHIGASADSTSRTGCVVRCSRTTRWVPYSVVVVQPSRLPCFEEGTIE